MVVILTLAVAVVVTVTLDELVIMAYRVFCYYIGKLVRDERERLRSGHEMRALQVPSKTLSSTEDRHLTAVWDVPRKQGTF